jgi:hypothetical protein
MRSREPKSHKKGAPLAKPGALFMDVFSVYVFNREVHPVTGENGV